MEYPTKQSATLESEKSGHGTGNMEGGALLVVALICVFFVILLRRAWLCDDAFITFRTVDNFINGYRLTWNITERVQAYTHPLWMIILSLLYFFTHEIYFTSLALSIGLSLAVLILLARRFSLTAASAAFAIFVLALSKAFVDYSTSGLENPLSHLLLVIFFILLFNRAPGEHTVFWLSLVASLGMITRQDLVLVFLPGLAFTYLQARSKRALLFLALGQLPLLSWELFSIFYYGFPFPNTAYAKLNTGIPQGEYIRQGFLYLLNSVKFDPITPLVILLGMASIFRNRDRRLLLLGAAILLYLGYVVKVGGDFMSGRFLTVPLLCAALALARTDFSRLGMGIMTVLFGLMLVVGLNVVNPTMRINDLGPLDSGPIHQWDNGILDERMLYYGGTGLLNAPRDEPMPTFYWAIDGEKMRVTRRKVADNYGIGMFAFRAGPQVYVQDKLALADPLLARLPAFYKADWRIGHFERSMPAGYLQTLELGQNKITDPNLALYYDKLSIIIKGGLFDGQRFVEIWKMNTGQYNYLIDREVYRFPGALEVRYPEVNASGAIPPNCQASGAKVFQDSGIEVTMPEVSQSRWIEAWLDHNDRYRIIYYRGAQELATETIPTAHLPAPGGISARMIPTPKVAFSQGFDRLRILPLTGETPYCLGYLALR